MPSDTLRASSWGPEPTLPPGWTAKPSPSRAYRHLLPGHICPQVLPLGLHSRLASPRPLETGVEGPGSACSPNEKGPSHQSCSKREPDKHRPRKRNSYRERRPNHASSGGDELPGGQEL